MEKENLQESRPAQLIDLDGVIRKQENRLVRNLPQFIINIIKRVIKQKRLNQMIINHREKFGVDFVKGCMSDYNVKFKLYGTENLPKDARVIFVSNHPLGAADYGSLIISLSEYYSQIKVLANEVLTNIENFRGLLLPVGVFGKTSVKAKKDIDDVLAANDTQLLTFPAGMVSRKSKGKVEDSDWHRSFVRYAQLHKRDVIPIFVDEINSRMFYFISSFRRFIGLKLNLEVFLIPGEFFKKKNQTMKVYIGKPIPYTRFDDSKSHAEWAQAVKKEVYTLHKQ